MASTADRKNGPGLLSPTRRMRDVGAAGTRGDAATVCELDPVQTRYQVMKTGSDVGSLTNSRRTAREPLNLTLDVEHPL